MSFRDRIRRSRQRLSESMNVLFRRGPQLDEDFWDDLEETLILSDIGARAADTIVENLREQATRQALPDAYAVLDLLADEIAGLFAPVEEDPFRMNPVCVLFVGINGAGKTTTVGKIAYQAAAAGRKVLIGSADTFRAAAIEQLDVWGQRSGVEVVKRERGADPASVCYDVVARAEELGSDLVLIDTSGRLHTSDELMRELEKTVRVTRQRADTDVKTVLVIDATTGQNGLQQAREFDRALDLDGVVMTKLDGTAKGGIAVAVSHELGLPICRIGVGEGIEDLEPFNAHAYAEALFGDMRGEDARAQLADETLPETEEGAEREAAGRAEALAEPQPEAGEIREAANPEMPVDTPETSADTAEGEVAVESAEDETSSAETVESENFEVPLEFGEDAAESEEPTEEPAKKESFRAKMRRWFS